VKPSTYILAVAGLLLAACSKEKEVAPSWAFFSPDAKQPAVAPRLGVYTLPGSLKSYTQAQIDDRTNPPDWFPQSHPPLPTAVIKGGKGRTVACGECHLISGMGHPESSSMAGLPQAYLNRQMAEFRSGARGNHVLLNGKPQTTDTVQSMVAIAKAWPDSDTRAAIEYFSMLKPMAWVKVVETDTVPKSYVDRGHMRVQAPGNETEPLGQRIVELPQDLERALLRDPASGTIAYVPAGAIARGKALATRGPAPPCASCHGPELKGMGDIPEIAGRSPIYIFRQLYFFKEGSRSGAMAELMRPEVSSLTQADMIDLAAYFASLPP
jgi:cytochrome c553